MNSSSFKQISDNCYGASSHSFYASSAISLARQSFETLICCLSYSSPRNIGSKTRTIEDSDVDNERPQT